MIDPYANEVAVTISTFYNTDNSVEKIRSSIALRTINRIINLGYDLYIIDAGSSSDFIAKLDELGTSFIKDKPNLGENKRKVLEAAYKSGKKVIVLMEPEKESLVSELYKTVKPIIEGKADIIIPKRLSLTSYPKYQQYSEAIGNLYIKELIGYDLDIFFGPRVISREMADYFLDRKKDYDNNWNILYLPILQAIKDKKKVISVDVNYIHPKEQTEIEEHNLDFYFKRIKQQLLPIMEITKKYWEK